MLSWIDDTEIIYDSLNIDTVENFRYQSEKFKQDSINGLSLEEHITIYEKFLSGLVNDIYEDTDTFYKDHWM